MLLWGFLVIMDDWKIYDLPQESWEARRPRGYWGGVACSNILREIEGLLQKADQS